MKNLFVLSLAFVGSSAFASLDARLVEYQNGKDVVKNEGAHVMLREDAMILGEALTTLEALSTDKDNRECQFMSIHRFDENSFEITTRTNGTVQLMKVVSAENRLFEAVRAGGEISRAPIGPLESSLVEPVGKSFKMLRLRTLAIRNPSGTVGPGDTYNILQIYYAETEIGPKILKIETEGYSAKQTWPMGPYLQSLDDVGGACEPHRASANVHHPVYSNK